MKLQTGYSIVLEFDEDIDGLKRELFNLFHPDFHDNNTAINKGAVRDNPALWNLYEILKYGI